MDSYLGSPSLDLDPWKPAPWKSTKDKAHTKARRKMAKASRRCNRAT